MLQFKILLLEIYFLASLTDLDIVVVLCFYLHDAFMFRPGLFGNEVARVLGGGLAPGCMLSS